MKVVHVPRRFITSDWGGTETVLAEICPRLTASQWDSSIFTSLILTNLTEETVFGIPVKRYPYFYPYTGLKTDARKMLDKKGGNLFSFQLMKSLIQEPDLDLIHIHTGKRMGGICRHAALKRGIPYVVTLHGGVHDVPEEEAATWTAPTDGTIEWGKLLGWWVGSRRVLKDADAIVCVGKKEQLMSAKQYPGKRVEYIPNGVDIQRFASGDGQRFRQKHNIEESAQLMAVIGRFDPQKNQALAIEIFSQLAPRHKQLKLLLLGHVTNESYYAELCSRIDGEPWAERIIMIPGVATGSNDLVDAYHAADLFLLPSRHEPFGIVILEAWCAGLPVVVSNAGGIPYFVDDQEDGLVCESDNQKDFYDAVDAVLTNKNLADKLARNGCRKAEDSFSWDHVTEQHVRLYEDLIKQRTRS